MSRLIAFVFGGLMYGSLSAMAQGITPFGGPVGDSGLIIDHGGGLQTFQDHTGRQGTIQGLGNGFSIYRDSHGSTGLFTDSGPGIPPEQGQWGNLEFRHGSPGQSLREPCRIKPCPVDRTN